LAQQSAGSVDIGQENARGLPLEAARYIEAESQSMQPDTRYAKSGDVHIAYQVFGEGPINLVLVPGFVSNLELFWDQPESVRVLLRLASYARVAIFDKRGTGVSDRVAGIPHLDERMDDLRSVMDAAGMEQAAVWGISEGGALSMLFAATYPDRCRALVLFGAWARANQEAVEEIVSYIESAWGTGGSLPLFAPSRADDLALQIWWRKLERLGASPAAAATLMRMNGQINVNDILPTIRVPTLVIHRTGDRVIPIKAGRNLAKHIPGARFIELPGDDHLFFVGDNIDRIADAIEEFLTGSHAPVDVDRVLATVLFTDIVGSTDKAEALGDQRWRDLLANHNAAVRRSLDRFRGREVKTTGDGFLAVFDGPARGIRCACSIADEVGRLGIEVRAGLHTGECDVMGDDYGGIAVHIGARVAALASAGEVLVSSTVKDLVAGSGLRFNDLGVRSLKGVQDQWRLFAVER
jgi:pimeloyl-ACP methyl ester carboxylesterase